MLAVFVKCVRKEQSILKKNDTNDNKIIEFKTLSRDWYRCGHLIQLLQIHNPIISEEWLKKQKYCRFKAI